MTVEDLHAYLIRKPYDKVECSWRLWIVWADSDSGRLTCIPNKEILW